MKIKEIELKDFRNYESLNLKLHDKVNIFIGDNAQGKTNIIESIYVSSIGKSFRTRDDRDMIRFGSEFARIKVVAEKEDDDVTAEILFTGKGKGIKVNGIKLRKASELLENIYVVIFSPEDLKIVKEDPEKRRKFINTELCMISSSYYSLLTDYRKIIKQRNTFLKDIRYEKKEDDINVLEIWDEQLASYGSGIIKKRKEFVDKINIISSELHKGITGGKENLEIIYEPSIPFNEDYEEQKKTFFGILKENRNSDIKNGNTGRGPHRDDICIKVNGIDMRKFGSQGQQRTAALSLKLAELRLIKEETGENAVLLLDDVMSELDASRQNFLIDSLGDVQLFITTADMSEEVREALPDGKTFSVEKGKIR